MSRTQRAADLLHVLSGAVPGQLVIQTTNHCNGACPQCGMRRTADIQRCRLRPEQIRPVLEQCARHNFQAVSLTGGEPFVHMDGLFSLLEEAGKAGIPYLRTGTNGFMFTDHGEAADLAQITDFVLRLSATKVRNFWISVDSADTPTHERMRGLPGVVAGIEKALPVFHAHGLYPAANLGINRNILGEPVARLTGPEDEARFLGAFQLGFTAFFQKVIRTGFTMANVCYPMSSDNENLENPAYGAISGDFIVSFSPRERQLVFQALFDVLPDFRHKIRIFTPRSVLYALSREDGKLLFPCLGGVRFFYMDSRDGHLYPCGYRGEDDLGETLEAALQRVQGRKPDCFLCHWECFRDPSQLFGIARYLIRHPIQALARPGLDPTLRKLWLEDLLYSLRCGLFDGRSPGPLG